TPRSPCVPNRAAARRTTLCAPPVIAIPCCWYPQSSGFAPALQVRPEAQLLGGVHVARLAHGAHLQELGAVVESADGEEIDPDLHPVRFGETVQEGPVEPGLGVRRLD